MENDIIEPENPLRMMISFCLAVALPVKISFEAHKIRDGVLGLAGASLRTASFPT
jgi:hypothetical protein